MDRIKVTSWTRGSQVALGIALLFAAAVAFAGFPGSGLPAHQRPEAAPGPATPPPSDATAKPDAEPIAVADMAARIRLVANHPKPVEVAPTDAPSEVAPAPAASEIKYLGPIGIGGRKLALLVIAGKQVILAEGDTMPGTEHHITQVTDLEVQIDEGGKEPKKVERANKSAVSVTQVVNPAAPKAAPSASGPTDAPVTENMRDRIKAARERRAALRGQRGTPPGASPQSEENPGDAPR